MGPSQIKQIEITICDGQCLTKRIEGGRFESQVSLIFIKHNPGEEEEGTPAAGYNQNTPRV